MVQDRRIVAKAKQAEYKDTKEPLIFIFCFEQSYHRLISQKYQGSRHRLDKGTGTMPIYLKLVAAAPLTEKYLRRKKNGGGKNACC